MTLQPHLAVREMGIREVLNALAENPARRQGPCELRMADPDPEAAISMPRGTSVQGTLPEFTPLAMGFMGC